MQCPSCQWTTVSYDMDSRQWRCKRCHAVVTSSGRLGAFGAASQPSSPPRTPTRSGPAAKRGAVARTPAKSGAKRPVAKRAAAARAKAAPKRKTR